MSIIYDALKKIETAAVKKSENKPCYNKDTQEPSGKPVMPAGINSYFLRMIAVICAGLGLVYLLKSAKPASETPPKVLFQETASTNSNLLNSFILSGVFFSESDSYAIINDCVVREGDSINGATLTRVNLDEVELDNNGKKILLSAKQVRNTF